jgi:ribonuclease VapC
VILDASAVVSMFLREPGWEGIAEKIGQARTAGIGAPTLAETGIVLTARFEKDSRPLLFRFIHEFDIAVVPFGEFHWREAIAAFARYGKGRHAAALNFGDCLTYAVARLARRPLLCTGRDFAKTDLTLA